MSNEKEALDLYQPMQADVAIHRPPEKVLEEARQAAVALKDVVDKKAKRKEILKATLRVIARSGIDGFRMIEIIKPI